MPVHVHMPMHMPRFVRLERLQSEALAALDGVAMDPPASRQRLEAFVRGRKEWCLSRQRSWGVPLPALYHVHTGEPLLTDESVAHVQVAVRTMPPRPHLRRTNAHGVLTICFAMRLPYSYQHATHGVRPVHSGCRGGARGGRVVATA